MEECHLPTLSIATGQGIGNSPVTSSGINRPPTTRETV